MAPERGLIHMPGQHLCPGGTGMSVAAPTYGSATSLVHGVSAAPWRVDVPYPRK